MFELKDVNLEKEMNEALHFVAENIKNTGNNKKPVLLHSFKLGMMLYSYNYSRTIILAGILHDLLEDTLVDFEEIKNKYGHEISNIVNAVSINSNIDDELKQVKLMFEQCLNLGFNALIVKCADLLDNIDYVLLVKDLRKRDKLFFKYKMFLDIAKETIGNEKIYKALEHKYDKLITGEI